jgi:transcriptional regulator with XRE-family HTH domain
MKRAFRTKTKPRVDPVYVALKERRIEMNMSQLDLGSALGYSERTISSWETGVRDPTLNALRNWAQCLGKRIKLEDAQ